MRWISLWTGHCKVLIIEVSLFSPLSCCRNSFQLRGDNVIKSRYVTDIDKGLLCMASKICKGYYVQRSDMLPDVILY
jgi:hypothetical protein